MVDGNRKVMGVLSSHNTQLHQNHSMEPNNKGENHMDYDKETGELFGSIFKNACDKISKATTGRA